MKKVLLVLLSSVLLFLSLPITSYAYPPEFDPEYYGSHNPDVVAVYGNDPESLYNHYKDAKEIKYPFRHYSGPPKKSSRSIGLELFFIWRYLPG